MNDKKAFHRLQQELDNGFDEAWKIYLIYRNEGIIPNNSLQLTYLHIKSSKLENDLDNLENLWLAMSEEEKRIYKLLEGE